MTIGNVALSWSANLIVMRSSRAAAVASEGGDCGRAGPDATRHVKHAAKIHKCFRMALLPVDVSPSYTSPCTAGFHRSLLAIVVCYTRLPLDAVAFGHSSTLDGEVVRIG